MALNRSEKLRAESEHIMTATAIWPLADGLGF